MKLNTGIITAAVSTIVVILVLFTAYSTIVPDAGDAGDELGDEARCGDVGCFWNDSRATDCTANNLTAGDTTACASNYEVPLSGLFSSSGIVFIIIMAMLLIVIVKGIMTKK